MHSFITENMPPCDSAIHRLLHVAAECVYSHGISAQGWSARHSCGQGNTLKHPHTHTHTHKHIHTRTHYTHTHTQTHARTYTYTHTYTPIHTHAHPVCRKWHAQSRHPCLLTACLFLQMSLTTLCWCVERDLRKRGISLVSFHTSA